MSAPASQNLFGAYPPSPIAGRRRAQLVESGARAASVQVLSLADVCALKDDRSPVLARRAGRQVRPPVRSSGECWSQTAPMTRIIRPGAVVLERVAGFVRSLRGA